MIFINKVKYISSWIPVLVLMIIIFSFSSQTADESSASSGGFSRILAEILHKNFGLLDSNKQEKILNTCQFIVRKSAHFSIYGLMGVLSMIACKICRLNYPYIISASICLLYAVSDEIHQYFVKGRSCELRDVIIDFSGAVTGIIAVLIILSVINKIRKRRKS